MSKILATLDERERASERFFDHWAKSYEERRISPWFRFTQHLAIDHLGLHPDSALLDVGCGTGYAVRVAAAMMPEGRASGIDISAVMLERARTKLEPDIRDRVEFRQANSADIPYPDATFSHLLVHEFVSPLSGSGSGTPGNETSVGTGREAGGLRERP